MKTILLTIAFLLYALPSPSQTNEWTWVSGDSVLNTNGIYSTKGTTAIGNKPGSRYGSVSWTDNSGVLWLFGGWGYPASGSFEILNDLWAYNTGSNQWTWVGGDSTTSINGVYGTKGLAAPGNKPGSRYLSTSWTDNSGNLWLFGGTGNTTVGGGGYLNDLWKYNIGSNQWAWVSGDSTANNYGVYGTKGIPSVGNRPGGRRDPVSWADNSGNLWLFGGLGYDSVSPGSGFLNDLWKYDIGSNQWTWVSGDSTEGIIYGVYGTKGTPATGNKPGSREYSISWTDNSGSLWLFGGVGYLASGGNGYLNDLWKYDIGSNQWTWISGDSIAGVYGIYGTRGTAAAVNKPGSRYVSISWADNSGNLWLFGGFGYSVSASVDYLNDLWEYNVGSNQWTWVGGDSIADINGVYGTKGAPAAGNKPGSREYSISWTDHSGSLWLFGGQGYAASGGFAFYLNDLWGFKHGSVVLPPIAQYSASGDTVCAGTPVSFTDQSTGSPANWRWTFTGGTPGTSISQDPKITYDTPGTYPVKLVVGNSGGTDSLIKTAYITVQPLPVPVVSTTDSLICSSDSTQVCASGGSTYVWNTNETSSCIYVFNAGGYWVTATGADGCSAVSGHQDISVYPVPSVSIIVQGDTLSSFGAVSYQWYFNNSPIPNATGPLYIAGETGNYSVEVTDTNGCKALSNNTYVVITGISQPAEGGLLTIYPDPFTNTIFIKEDETGAVIQHIKIYDVLGRIMLSKEYNISTPLIHSVDVSALLPAVYYIRVETNQGGYIRSLIKK